MSDKGYSYYSVARHDLTETCRVTFTMHDDQVLDTRVAVTGYFVVAGSERLRVLQELRELVARYQI